MNALVPAEPDFLDMLADKIAARLAVLLATAPVDPAANPKPPMLIDQEAVPGFLNISRPTFFRYKAGGKFPKPVSLDGSNKYRIADLEAWVMKLKLGKPGRRVKAKVAG